MSHLLSQFEVEELQRQLEESEATLTAIRNGEVDAIVVDGREIYTLEGADHPYRVLVEAMQQGAVTLTADATIVYCNDGFARMVRRPVEKLIGTSVTGLFPSGDRRLLLERLADGGHAGQVELSLHADNGTRLPVLVSFNLMPLDGVLATCLVITDLTEHRHNQRLQDSDRRKDEFLAMLAHELRNPLAPIANAVQVLNLSNREQSAEVAWACDLVARQVRQLTRIVDDLLDVSRITRGKINLQKERTPITTVITAAVEASRPLVESRRHQLHIELLAETLLVEVDVVRMAQVLTNLLNNSAKYTDEGGEIWLSVRRDGDLLKISVRDNGAGMSADMLATVFDLFTQADRTIDRSQGGLGIGLTLVNSLVELHGGSVDAASPGLGQGSEFTVWLPLAVDESRGMPRPAGAASNGMSKAASHRVLVVDDNVDSAGSLARMLRAMGHEARVSHDGAEAIDAALDFRPALVLLDIGLPGMNGYAVAERLRGEATLGGVVLAALTGYGEDQDRQRSQEAGFDRHIVKPIDMSVLQELISQLPHGGK